MHDCMSKEVPQSSHAARLSGRARSRRQVASILENGYVSRASLGVAFAPDEMSEEPRTRPRTEREVGGGGGTAWKGRGDGRSAGRARVIRLRLCTSGKLRTHRSMHDEVLRAEGYVCTRKYEQAKCVPGGFHCTPMDLHAHALLLKLVLLCPYMLPY